MHETVEADPAAAMVFPLTFALPRLYPTAKCGDGHACTRLSVGGEIRPVLRTAERAA
ncbi:MAG: hypothetical protein J2P53_16015 [Bradyrhizobiaceae bacterium]|nr:hypothetical protein [Bradyrhizobiaceae bacterium]